MSVRIKATAWLTLTCDPAEDDDYKDSYPLSETNRDIEKALRDHLMLIFDKVEVDTEYEAQR